MSNEIHPANPTGNGGYERSDIGVARSSLFPVGPGRRWRARLLRRRMASIRISKNGPKREQAPVSPLVTNAPTDTRQLSADYKDYLKQSFPSSTTGRSTSAANSNEIRIDEEQTLSTYDWVDQKAGTVRIPIDRAMDLIAQRGLPVRAQAQGSRRTAGNTARLSRTKGTRK